MPVLVPIGSVRIAEDVMGNYTYEHRTVAPIHSI